MVEILVVEKPKIDSKPKFRNPEDLPPESLTDPDYRLKQIVKLSGDGRVITCSKCHHCRG